MGKRKISRQQAWRIEKIQEERRKRAAKRDSQAASMLTDDHLGPEQKGLVITRHGARLEVEKADGQVFQCLMRQHLGDVVSGDEVLWQESQHENGVVTALMPRSSTLARPDAHGHMKAMAANIQNIVIVVAPEPPHSIERLDPYLLACQATDIQPIIVVNKIDALDEKAFSALQDHFNIYKKIHYPVIYTSTMTETGLDELLAYIDNRTCVFIGQSGVGKSSILARLLPHEIIRVGELSEATGHGQHTTSNCRLYHFTHGGDLIDSPGIREFKLWHMDAKDIARNFVEFAPHIEKCKFRNCRHIEEPECAIKTAVTNGLISEWRYTRYLALLKTYTKD